MYFPVSGIECPVWLPPAAAFVIALVTAPAGISGAFLLLPFQITVLGFASPAVTPTNLIYNAVAVPGGVYRYAREGCLDWGTARLILGGTLPGVFLGAVIRVRWLPDPRAFKLFAGIVLLVLGARLLGNVIRRDAGEPVTSRPGALLAVALLVGILGGIYGVGGGAMIAPFAMTFLRLPARGIAGAALLGTFVTSLAGIASFEILRTTHLSAGLALEPDWRLGLLFGAGGLLGSYLGAGMQKHLPERFIRFYLGLLVVGLGSAYTARFFLSLLLIPLGLGAQCILDNPGGSKVNINRPVDADVPAAGFSPLARFNRTLPEWLCFTAGYRTRIEEQAGDTYLLTRFRLGLALRPASWFRVYTELQDATAFWKTPPLGPPLQSTWDLRRGYVDLGDTERNGISLRVGRQDLAFGHLRLIGTAYWRNASRGWDAALMSLHSTRLRLYAFAASPVVALDNGFSHHQQGNNLHGVYASLNGLIPASAVEPYVLWRLARGVRTEAGAPATADRKTIGLRWAGAAGQVDYDAELAAQAGAIGPDSIRAWAWSAVAGYTFAARFKPRIFAKYDFASGDRNPRDGVRGTFDQLFPNIHDHHGLADQVAWQNLKSLRAGARVSLRRNWIVAAAYNDWWLASANDGFYNASGALVARDPSGHSGNHIGREFDLQTSYRMNRLLEFGAGLGHIRPGAFLSRTNHVHPHNYPYAMVNYNFF